MSAHHPLGASKHPAWAQCACFDSDVVGEAALRGTEQHRALECLLKGIPYDGAPLDEDEQDAVLWASNEIRKDSLGAEIKSEITLEFFESDDEFEPTFFGTADAVIVRDGYADLYDYKSGERRDYKSQMDAYAAMVCQAFKLDYCYVHMLYGKYRDRVQSKIEQQRAVEGVRLILARRNDPDKKPNPCDYCGWCKHRATCSALAEGAAIVAAGRPDWQLDTYHASEITRPAQMAKALKLARLLKDWADAIEHAAKEMAVKQGFRLPGWTLGRRQGNRRIADPAGALSIAQALGMSTEDFLKACTVRLGELEKTVGKKKFAEAFDGVIKRDAEQFFLTATKNQ